MESNKRPSEGQRRYLKENVVSVIDELELSLLNMDAIHSRRDYNKYIVDFSSVFDSLALKQFLIIETSVFIRAYPTMRMPVSSFIYDYLKQEKRDDIIEQFELEPFELNVQSVERTFVDKLFAIGDYYLRGKVTEHSRHIYDLYKLYNVVDINEALKDLFIQVREERSRHANCFSAQNSVDFKELIQEIISKKIYKNDYETITTELLFETVDYETAIQVLRKIIKSGLLDYN